MIPLITLIPFQASAQVLKPRAVPSDRETPPDLAPSENFMPLGCDRKATLDGREIRIDSYHCKDGEGLRKLFLAVPDAQRELDLYQSTRNQAQIAAYTGSFGLLAIVVGWIVSSQMNNSQDALKVRQWTFGGGITITTGSLIYGLGMLSASETHLENAVEEYNKVNPKQPLGLEIKTGIHF